MMTEEEARQVVQDNIEHIANGRELKNVSFISVMKWYESNFQNQDADLETLIGDTGPIRSHFHHLTAVDCEVLARALGEYKDTHL